MAVVDIAINIIVGFQDRLMSDESDVVKESAKAAQEIAKTTGKVIDASQTFGGFISRYISGPLEQGVGIFEDKLKYMRWERQARLMKRADEFWLSQGLGGPTKAIPLKLAVPLFQAASLEDDDDLQDRWARLLVNGANVDSGVDLQRAYIDILERLTPLEAMILDKIYSLPCENPGHVGIVTEGLPETVALLDGKKTKQMQEPKEEVKLALANLSRLGCLAFPSTWDGGEIFTHVCPTLMGQSFVRACTFKVPQEA